MDQALLSIKQAASLLGVTPATLRNWDRSGRLVAKRDPANGYRYYDADAVRAVAAGDDLEMFPENDDVLNIGADGAGMPDQAAMRRVIGRVHDTLRDIDGSSSIIERFDELTRLLFCRVLADHHGLPLGGVSDIRASYDELLGEFGRLFPEEFRALRGSDEAIEAAMAPLATLSIGSDVDIAGVAYEEIIRRTFDKGDNQQFFTPGPVVEFMIDLCEEWLAGDVCDPASGTGGFLARAALRGQAASLTGLEIDRRLAWVTGVNVLLHGSEDVTARALSGGGTLGPSAETFDGTFDLILTNPPFGSEVSDQATLGRFVLGQGKPARRRGILFVEACHRLLREGGRAAIVIDDGVLNLPHAEDVREFIRARFGVEAVVSLPESAFMPYASVKTSILLLTKDGRQPRQIFFGVADKVGRRPNGDEDLRYEVGKPPALVTDLPSILDSWTGEAARSAGPDGTAFRAALSTESSRLDTAFHHPSRAASQAALDAASVPLVPLVDICAERRETVIPSKELPDSAIPFTGLAHIESGTGRARQELTPTASLKSGVRRYEAGDILFSRMRPGLRKVALMDQPGFASAECAVLVVRCDEHGEPLVHPELLATLLRSDFVFGQIVHLIAGIGRPRISQKDLRGVRIPMASATMSEQALAGLNASTAAMADLNDQIARLEGEREAERARVLQAVAGALVGTSS